MILHTNDWKPENNDGRIKHMQKA